MTLRHLKIFVTVCTENSITLAAKKLYISQPAVSNTIKELESYYGAPLFDRISKKLYLTETGKTVFHYANHIISLFDELETSIKNADSGNLRIGASITIGTFLIPDYIKEFSMRFPNLQAFVTIDSSDIIERLVLDNELDIALIEGIVHSEQLITKEFIDDELVVICDPNNRLLRKGCVSLEDLIDQPFLMREKNSGTRELTESILSLYNITVTPLWESSSTEAIVHGVSKGIGISILPLQLVQGYINRKEVARLYLDNVRFNRQYHIIYHKSKFLTPAAQEFITMCTSK
jgi:DNA-binding transcriptional LysR family regulator